MKKLSKYELNKLIKERTVINIPANLAIGISKHPPVIVGIAKTMRRSTKISGESITVINVDFYEGRCSLYVERNIIPKQKTPIILMMSYASLNKLIPHIDSHLKPFDHSYILKEHSSSLVDTASGGNGYHGRCAYCGLAFVTDLGYCSWEGTTCTEREPTSIYDFPEDIRSYVNFNGLDFKSDKQIFTKAYSDRELTYTDIRKIIDELI